jgi:DNA-binding CsgD family transcriptional regulator
METRDLMMGANWALWAKALLLEARGDRAGAALALARAWDALPELRYLFSNWMMAADMVRLALAAGDRRRAEAVTEELAAVAERAPGTGAVGAALRCRGLLGRDAALLVEAVRAYDAVSRPMERALAAEDAAYALSRDERSAAATRLLEESLAGYERLGASYDIARVTQALRRSGVRRGSRATRGRESMGWAALTQTELAVAQLVAEGLTNPQIAQRLFISRHTVETHMKHVLAKLGAVSRAQVAAEAARHAG